jgi:hypothetical protein
LADHQLKVAMVPVATTKYEGGWQRIPEAALIDALRTRSEAVLVSNKPPRDRLPHVTVDERWYTQYTLVAKD